MTNTFHTFTIPEVPCIQDEAFAHEVQALLDSKTKPLGSLGKLEQLAHRIACIVGSPQPALHVPQMLVFAADHGLAAQHGVSAFPVDVTWQMVENFLAGGAAVNVLSRRSGIALHVVDCGVSRDIPDNGRTAPAPSPTAPRLWLRKVARGTRDCTQEPAMTPQECAQAMSVGAEIVRQLPGNAVLLGEMGIGNTSSASLIVARLCNVAVQQVTGRGTGLDDAGVQRKVAVLEKVLARHPGAQDPLDALAALGGLEIAAMTGAMLQAAHERRVIVVDGFITTAALLVASRLRPAVLQRCVFAHQSGEPGHATVLQALQAQPLLSWRMRLGEGSGAATVWPLLESACAILCEMASFTSAGVDKAVR